MFNKQFGTLYVGVTSNLPRRVNEHKSKTIKGFTSKYGIDKLAYYEVYENILMAIEREKQIKSWCRRKKLALITSANPNWQDLFDMLA